MEITIIFTEEDIRDYCNGGNDYHMTDEQVQYFMRNHMEDLKDVMHEAAFTEIDNLLAEKHKSYGIKNLRVVEEVQSEEEEKKEVEEFFKLLIDIFNTVFDKPMLTEK